MSDFRIRKGKPEDCKAVLNLIRELAIYEKAAHEVEINLEQLKEDGFGPDPAYELLVSEMEGKIRGMALYYQKYSTWKGRALYLEDLVVEEAYRGKGMGKALFLAVVRRAYETSAGRMEWQVLDWNQPSIDFYRDFGATIEEDWLNGRFSRERIRELCAR